MRIALLLVVLGGLGLAHRPLLRWAACGLIVDDHEEQTPDAIWLGGGDRRFQAAADLYRENPRCRILIARSFRDRVVQVAVLPPLEELARNQLLDRGVPSEAVVFFGDSCRDSWEGARALQGWMKENPNKRVLVLCDRFRSRQRLEVLAQVLQPQEAARIGIRGLPAYRYDETDWWRNRTGLKRFMYSWLGLLCVWMIGETAEKPIPLDPDAYERLVAGRIGGETR
jgi:hypothetical protein